MDKIKPVLAIETSGSLCSVCIYYTDEHYFENNMMLKHSHSEKLFDLIEKTMSLARVGVEDLGYIAVSAGPGSFTGLRIGLSAAKGIAAGSGLGILPVPTFEAFALQAMNYSNNLDYCCVASKASSDEVYFAKFQFIDNNYIFVENLQVISKKDAELKSTGVPVYGNGLKIKRVPEEPSALFAAKWSVLYGKGLETKNFDYLEPNYIKNFIVKGFENA